MAGAAKLGDYSSATVDIDGHRLTIVNAYTQLHWRGTGVKVDYAAVRAVMGKIKRDFPGARIGYPRIGAGLAGGDWATLRRIIQDELAGTAHWLVEYAP